MTLLELIQGLMVRILIMGILVACFFAMAINDVDIVLLELSGATIELPWFSMLGAIALWYVTSHKLLLDYPPFQWLILIVGIVIALTQWDRISVPMFSADLEIRVMSLLGIVALQNPIAIWILKIYQRKAGKTDRTLKIRMAGREQISS